MGVNRNVTTKRLTKKKLLALICMLGGYSLLSRKRNKIRRRWWVRPWLENKCKAGLKLVKKEFKDDQEQYEKFLRMPEKVFHKLLLLVRHRIQKKNTNFRNAVSPKEKLIVTLRFLATGESYRSLMYTFRISESTISLFVPTVCRVIYEVLKNDYLKTPTTAAEWLNISKDFQDIWNFPNTIGALDGKHVVFQAPRSAGSTYYNYKGTHSIVLLALVDAKYNFTYVDVGVNGRVSDGGVFRESTLAKAIANNCLNIPESRRLPGRNIPVPHIILCDSAFPLSEHILKPYPLNYNTTDDQRIFNYRLSRARRVVENAFGMLANRFRIFLNTINLSPEKVQIITLASCALHNFLRIENPQFVPDSEGIDGNIEIKFGLSHQGGNRTKDASLAMREEFKDYIMNEGAMPWQYARA